MASSFNELSSFIWSVADLLRGDFRQSEYGRVMLPFTVLRRLDCRLAHTKEVVTDSLARQPEAESRTKSAETTRKRARHGLDSHHATCAYEFAH